MPTLLELPPEMFERIAECADPHDLLALRLVCKDAASKVFRTYCQTHFAELRVRLTEEDLNIALDIADHPILGAILCSLAINIKEINWDGRYPHVQSADLERGYRHPFPSREQQLVRAEQSQFRQRRLDLHLLTTLLCKLKKRCKSLIAVSVVKSETRPQLKHSHSASRLAAELVSPPLSVAWAFSTLMEAVALSGLPFIFFDAQHYEWALPVHNFIPDEKVKLNFLDAFESVECFRLTAWYDYNAPRFPAESFANALSRLPKLHKLVIAIQDSCHDQWFTEDRMDDSGMLASVILAQTYPCLTLLKLEQRSYLEDTSLPVLFEELLDFARRSGTDGKLQHLVLEDVRVIGRAQHMENTVEDEDIEAMLERLTGVQLCCLDCFEATNDD